MFALKPLVVMRNIEWKISIMPSIADNSSNTGQSSLLYFYKYFDCEVLLIGYTK